MITYDEFKNIELRIGRIIQAERVDQSEKLICLKVDLGEETRQIVAGIGKHYEPESLLNTYIVVLANLEPRSIMGLESRGMLLAASNKEKISLALIRPDGEISPGSLVG